ncbi:hypothetical protein DPX16_0966 [Anabarilius grahami]|uniref:Uncharacterized protein n=1 Tax=Anabarilius grahami TaxID=495550 RepID=A0A3N0YHP1_ANAGA|nr:hypothetical protein DPX16_0966 [Anabarilius grahami]
MLLKIRDTVNNLPQCAKNGHSNTPPPLLASVPAYLWRPVCALPRNKRRRRRGKRGRLLVKLKAYLASSRVDYSGCSLNGIPRDFTKFDLRRSLEYCYRWLRPAFPDAGCSLPCRRPVRIQTRGCVEGNLRPLSRAAQQTVFTGRRRIITSTTAGEFAAAFMNTTLYSQDIIGSPLCPEDFISSFHYTCSEILNNIAPFRGETVHTRVGGAIPGPEHHWVALMVLSMVLKMTCFLLATTRLENMLVLTVSLAFRGIRTQAGEGGSRLLVVSPTPYRLSYRASLVTAKKSKTRRAGKSKIVVWSPGVCPVVLVLYVPGLIFSSLFLVSVCYIGFSFWITFTDHHTDTRTHLTDHHSLRTFTAHRSPCVTTLLLSVLLLCVYIVSYNLV